METLRPKKWSCPQSYIWWAVKPGFKPRQTSVSLCFTAGQPCEPQFSQKWKENNNPTLEQAKATQMPSMVIIKLFSQNALILTVLVKHCGWNYITKHVIGRLFQVPEAKNNKNFSKPQYHPWKKKRLEISDHHLKELFKYLKVFTLSVRGNIFSWCIKKLF